MTVIKQYTSAEKLADRFKDDGTRGFSFNSKKVSLSIGNLKITFAGTFGLIDGDIESGTITGLNVYLNRKLQYSASDVKVDISGLLHLSDVTSFFKHLEAKAMRGADKIAGSPYGDKLRGFSGNDVIKGGAGNDKLYGGAGNDKLYGGSGKDTLNGGKGNDLLNGGTGADKLTGGAGKDIFVFNTKLGATNIDTITDFSVKDDTIYLDNAIFKKLGKAGALSKDFFRANTSGKAQDKNDYIIYETDTGKLFYDADGNGSGKAVQFALIGTDKHAKLTAADFVVI